MSVARYDPYGAYMEQRKDGDYVLYEDFERVFLALQCLALAMQTDVPKWAYEETAQAHNEAQQVVDQYE